MYNTQTHHGVGFSQQKNPLHVGKEPLFIKSPRIWELKVKYVELNHEFVVHYRPQSDHDPYKCIVTSCEAIYMRESKDMMLFIID